MNTRISNILKIKKGREGVLEGGGIEKEREKEEERERGREREGGRWGERGREMGRERD